MTPRILDDLVHDGLPVVGTALGVSMALKKGKGSAWWMYIAAGWLGGWGVSRAIQFLANDFPAVVPTTSLVPSTENEASTPLPGAQV